MVTKDDVVKYLSKYSQEDITEQIDEEIVSGNWVSSDDVEESECEDEYDWYAEHGNGEAECAIRDNIETEILEHFEISLEQYKEWNEEDLYETIIEVFADLDK